MGNEANLGWVIIYFAFSVLLYIWAAKAYFDYVSKARLFSKKISIKKQNFLWGEERQWTNNKKYIAKHVFLKRRSLLAKKYHKETIKTIFIVSGKLHLYAEKGSTFHDIILHPEEAYEIYPETHYLISAVTDARYIEISSYSINDNHSCNKEKHDRQRHRNSTRKYD